MIEQYLKRVGSDTYEKWIVNEDNAESQEWKNFYDEKWSTFFIGSLAENFVIGFVYNILIEYWKKKEYYVNYFMMDHLFDITYKENEDTRIMINTVKTENKKCLEFNRHYSEKVGEKDLGNFCQKQIFYKLPWRWWGNDASAPPL